jgi:hypothetical protein
MSRSFCFFFQKEVLSYCLRARMAVISDVMQAFDGDQADDDGEPGQAAHALQRVS